MRPVNLTARYAPDKTQSEAALRFERGFLLLDRDARFEQLAAESIPSNYLVAQLVSRKLHRVAYACLPLGDGVLTVAFDAIDGPAYEANLQGFFALVRSFKEANMVR